MATQRNPKVGDIVESLLWFPEEPIFMRYLKVTNLVEMKDLTIVQMKPFLDAKESLKDLKFLCEESLLFFSSTYVILENIDEKTLKVLYGTKS